MKVNQMAVRMAAKDLAAAGQYLQLAVQAADHAALILADEAAHDMALLHDSKQAGDLLGYIKHTAEAVDCIDLAELRGYSPPESAPAVPPASSRLPKAVLA